MSTLIKESSWQDLAVCGGAVLLGYAIIILILAGINNVNTGLIASYKQNHCELMGNSQGQKWYECPVGQTK